MERTILLKYWNLLFQLENLKVPNRIFQLAKITTLLIDVAFLDEWGEDLGKGLDIPEKISNTKLTGFHGVIRPKTLKVRKRIILNKTKKPKFVSKKKTLYSHPETTFENSEEEEKRWKKPKVYKGLEASSTSSNYSSCSLSSSSTSSAISDSDCSSSSTADF